VGLNLPNPIVVIDAITARTARAEVYWWRERGRISEDVFAAAIAWIEKRERALGIDGPEYPDMAI
jgi:hypothetical protein